MNRRIVILALGAFAFGTDVFVMAGVLPVIARDTGVSINTASLLITVFSLVFSLGAPFLAVLTNHISRQKLLLWVLLGFCLANLLAALSPTYLFLLAMRVLAAGCAALYMPNASVVASILASAEQRGKALGTVLGGFTMATVLGVPIGTWIGVHIGWQATFLFVVIITLMVALALILLGLPRVAIPPTPSLRALSPHLLTHVCCSRCSRPFAGRAQALRSTHLLLWCCGRSRTLLILAAYYSSMEPGWSQAIGWEDMQPTGSASLVRSLLVWQC